MSNHENRRRHPRIPFVAEVVYKVDGVSLFRRSADLSQGGIFIDDCAAPEVGTELDVMFRLNGDILRGRGRVAYRMDTFGFGVDLFAMDEVDREMIGLHVLSVLFAELEAVAV